MNDRLSSAGSPVSPHWGERAVVFLALLAALVMAACTPAPAREAQARGVFRIVSAVPSATEILVALGARDRLVARTSFDRDTLLAHLPTLGHTMLPSAEAILAYQPDLYIDADYLHSAEVARAFTERGVHTLTTRLQNFADVRALIDTLGVLLDLRARADSLNAALQARIAALQAGHVTLRASAIYVVWPLPARIAGGSTYMSEMLGWAGARNAFADLNGWPEVSLEAIVARNPDYIVIPAERAEISLAALRKLPGWKELPAIRAGRVIAIPTEMIEQPGPRLLDGAARLEAALRGAMR